MPLRYLTVKRWHSRALHSGGPRTAVQAWTGRFPSWGRRIKDGPFTDIGVDPSCNVAFASCSVLPCC